MDTIAGIILALVVIAAICFGIYNIAVENALFFWMALVSVGALFVARIVVKKKTEDAAYEALPAYGPMRISMETSESSRGKQHLLLTVTISKADLQTMQRSGLVDTVLCEVPPTTNWQREFNLRNYGSENTPFRARYLSKHTWSWEFDNIIELNDVKDRLTDGLHALRSQIDSYDSAKVTGASKESFEI
jgi:hypothetical protein